MRMPRAQGASSGVRSTREGVWRRAGGCHIDFLLEHLHACLLHELLLHLVHYWFTSVAPFIF